MSSFSTNSSIHIQLYAYSDKVITVKKYCKKKSQKPKKISDTLPKKPKFCFSQPNSDKRCDLYDE